VFIISYVYSNTTGADYSPGYHFKARGTYSNAAGSTGATVVSSIMRNTTAVNMAMHAFWSLENALARRGLHFRLACSGRIGSAIGCTQRCLDGYGAEMVHRDRLSLSHLTLMWISASMS